MLDNLFKSEGIPSPSLIRDVRTLASLTKDQLTAIAHAFDDVSDDTIGESIQDRLLPKMRELSLDPEALSSSIGVTLFVWNQWAKLDLTKEQVSADLESLDLPKEQLSNLDPLLNVLDAKRGILRKNRSQVLAISSGTPQIKSIHSVIDARAVFSSGDPESETQKYFEIDTFVPIAILEIVSILNDDESTHSFILTESTLKELCDHLDRTRKRLEIVKEQLPPNESSQNTKKQDLSGKG